MPWNGEPLWKGETCFIIAGGPSVRSQNLDLLRGRKVIVINSSVHVAPWADVLFFGDARWFRMADNRRAVDEFKGMVVTCADLGRPGTLTMLRKQKPPGLAQSPGSLMMRRTSLTAAINLAVHFGVKHIVLLGADGKATKDERGKLVTHHHAPHHWPPRNGCWDAQKKDLLTILAPLKQKGVEVLNASPGSAWGDLWPIVKLEDAVGVKGMAA